MTQSPFLSLHPHSVMSRAYFTHLRVPLLLPALLLVVPPQVLALVLALVLAQVALLRLVRAPAQAQLQVVLLRFLLARAPGSLPLVGLQTARAQVPVRALRLLAPQPVAPLCRIPPRNPLLRPLLH